MTVNTYNDWDPLEEIIIGSPFLSNVPEHDISMEHFFQTGKKETSDFYKGPIPEQIIEETEEDFQLLISILEKFGVTVTRPAQTVTGDHGGELLPDQMYGCIRPGGKNSVCAGEVKLQQTGED